MTCSLETYRSKVGLFYPKCRIRHSGNTVHQKKSVWNILAVCLVLALTCQLINVCMEIDYKNILEVEPVCNRNCFDATAWHDFISKPFWVTRKQHNKIMHSLMGNRDSRGKGIVSVYWNKGSSLLQNKQVEIGSLMKKHKPHVFGLGEANLKHGQYLGDVQQPDYTLHVDTCINNPNLGLARVVVYTHNSLIVKRRYDLEDDLTASIWLECGLANQRKFLINVAYRQWQLVGQINGHSATVGQQLKRWLMFLGKWETALSENKEVITMMDANIDFLTWRDNNLPTSHSSYKLKPLIDALFHRILPLGVTQLVKGATRVQRGCPKSGLDHVYSNKIDKISQVQTFLTGLSDHMLIKFIRFSKSIN